MGGEIGLDERSGACQTQTALVLRRTSPPPAQQDNLYCPPLQAGRESQGGKGLLRRDSFLLHPRPLLQGIRKKRGIEERLEAVQACHRKQRFLQVWNRWQNRRQTGCSQGFEGSHLEGVLGEEMIR